MKATKTRFKQLPKVEQVLPTQCLSCDSTAGYTPREVTQEIEFRGELFEVTYTHLACVECDDAILSDEQMVDRTKKVVAAYQQKHGLLTAAELIEKRESLGCHSQRQLLAVAPEIKEATLKRLEAGQRVQDASTDLAIRAVLKRLQKVKRKERMVSLTFAEAGKSETYTTEAHWTASPFGQFAKAACLTAACVLPITTTTKTTRRAAGINATPNVQQVSSC